MTKLPTSLPDALLRAAESTPDKPFIHFENRSYSYAEIKNQVAFVAGTLAAYGLAKGERVALYLENSPAFVTTYLGVLWCGGVVVPVNTRYREDELRHMLTDSGARLVVTDTAGKAEVDKVRDDAPAEKVVELTQGTSLDRTAWTSLTDPQPLFTEPYPLMHDDLAVIGYTSGTTGHSPGAMLTHGNFLSNSAAVTKAWRWTADDHLLLVLPLFHMHGLGVGLHGTLLQGATLTLHRKFDAEDVYRTLLAGEATMFFGVPTLYGRLLSVAKTKNEKPNVRLLVSGSAPLSAQTHREVEENLGAKILERYGMTETVMIAGNPFDKRRPGTVGVPFEGIELRIADEANETLPPCETGEVQLRGSNITKGYWQNDEATQAAWTSDGWFKTGDLGFIDRDGYLTLNGRARDLIISGGFNVYPREVEEVLSEVEGVEEVAVLGLPHDDLGEQVVAAVVGEVDEEDLLEYAKAHIASFKKPKKVYYVDELPRNALGKVQKHILKKQLEAWKA